MDCEVVSVNIVEIENGTVCVSPAPVAGTSKTVLFPFCTVLSLIQTFHVDAVLAAPTIYPSAAALICEYVFAANVIARPTPSAVKVFLVSLSFKYIFVPEATVAAAQESAPEPLVVKCWSDDPSAAGKV